MKTEDGSGLMFRKRRRRRASSDGEGEGGSQRVQLACFWCRSKRVRCSGTKPVCEVSRPLRVRVRRTRMILHTVKRVESVGNIKDGGLDSRRREGTGTRS
jgi:hypothetical protein